MIKVPCNMTEEERAGYEARFDKDDPSYEELDRAKGAFTPYLFYETWGRRDFRECFCPWCGRFELVRSRKKDIYYDDPFDDHHGDQTSCPMCSEPVQLVCLGRMRNMASLRQEKNVMFLREEDGALAALAGIATREYTWDDLDPTPWFRMTRRYVFRPGKRQAWRKHEIWEYSCTPAWSAHLVGHQWVAMKTCGEPFSENWMMSMSGESFIVGAEAIEKSELRWCEAEQYFHETTGQWLTDEQAWNRFYGVITYLAEYTRRPQLEMLEKLGFANIITQHLDGDIRRGLLDWRAKTPYDFFRITKRDFRAFQEDGIRMATLLLYRERGAQAQEMALREYAATAAYLDKSAEEFFRFCEERAIPARKARAYIEAQAPIGDTGRRTFTTWKDYLGMAAELERDLRAKRDLFPEDLQREHDAAMTLLRRRKMTEEEKEYGKGRFRRLKRRYAWSDGELQIVVPVNAEDIVLEGKALHHCVGGYATRHIEGKTTILFLRRCGEPNERYITIEINDATAEIRQVHGYGNDIGEAVKPMERHKEFFAAWLAWLRAGSPRSRNGKPVRVQTEKEAETA